MDKNCCWATLKYSRPLQFKTIPALKDCDRNTVVSMKAKEALVKKSAFLGPSPCFLEPPVTSPGLAHTKITEEIVTQALTTQMASKAPSPNKINFQIL